MKFEKHLPTEQLRPYIKYYVVSENGMENEYKVFPSAGLVVGFQYRGRLSAIRHETESPLAAAGVSGIADRFTVFKNSDNIGTILVYFTEIGFNYFSCHPANELFNLSIPLDEIFQKASIQELEEKLAFTSNDQQRLKLVEQFFLLRLKNIETDKLVVEAVRLIYQSKGTIRINELNKILCISQSPLEKRFRKVVGATPKKFASIVRFNSVLDHLDQTKSLTDICYENDFFDQAHFIRDFKQFTGETPEHFKRFL